METFHIIVISVATIILLLILIFIGILLSKGNENRDQSNLDSYVDWLAQQIYEFVNNDNIKSLPMVTSDYEE